MTAITDYASLKTAVLDEAQRAGQATFIALLPRFVQAAEQMIAYGFGNLDPVRVQDMETDADVTFTDGAGSVPSDYLEQVGLDWDSDLNIVPDYVTNDDFNRLRNRTASTYPSLYTVKGGSILLSPAASGTGKLRYYAKYAALSGDSDTNWLLANAPLVYFHAVCHFAFKRLRNDEKAAEHANDYAGAVSGIVRANERARTAGRRLRPFIKPARIRC